MTTTETDTRPFNCRHRQQDEGRAYPRSSCAHCHKTITTGLGRHCEFGSPPRAHSPAPTLEATAPAVSEAEIEAARASWPAPWEEYNLSKALRRALEAAQRARK